MTEDPDELVVVWWPRDEWEASAIRGALADQGIVAHCAGESRLGSSEFHYGAIPTRQIFVQRKNSKRALEFIRSHDWPSYTPGEERPGDG